MIGKLRLWTGLILFAYVATHLLNHALGLISIEAMELGRGPFTFVWAGYAGLAVLGASPGALRVLHGDHRAGVTQRFRPRGQRLGGQLGNLLSGGGR